MRDRRSLARRLLFGACGLSVLALFLVSVVIPRFGGPATAAVGLRIDGGSDAVFEPVGEAIYVGVELGADGAGTVHLLTAAVTGVPVGLEVSVGAQRPYLPLGPRYVGGASESDLRRNFPLWHMHPVSDVRMTPGADPGWSLVIVATPTKPGDFSTTGLEVTAEQGGRTATVHVDYSLRVQAPDPTKIDMSKPVKLVSDCPGSEAPTPPTWDAVVARAVRAGGGAAVVTFDPGTPPAVWNTVDGARPTQAMVKAGLRPAIYQPDPLVIRRVVAGSLPVGRGTGLVLGGEIGADFHGGCSFPIDARDLSAGGKTYLAIFGPALPFDHGARHPVLELRNVVPINGAVVETPYGPVPLSTP